MAKHKKEIIKEEKIVTEENLHASLTLFHNVDFIEVKSPAGKDMLISIDNISCVAPPWNDKVGNYESPYGKSGDAYKKPYESNEKSVIFLSSNHVIRSSNTVEEINLKIKQKLGEI